MHTCSKSFFVVGVSGTLNLCACLSCQSSHTNLSVGVCQWSCLAADREAGGVRGHRETGVLSTFIHQQSVILQLLCQGGSTAINTENTHTESKTLWCFYILAFTLKNLKQEVDNHQASFKMYRKYKTPFSEVPVLYRPPPS